jgi:hypothetical protein
VTTVINWEVPPSRRVAFVLVLLVAGASVPVSVAVGFRAGGYTLAAALGFAAALRAFLPARFCLGLLVRSRQFDVAMSAALALALAVTTRLVPVG